MIITVTMNPAIDKTIQIDTLIPGGLNRISHVEYDAGGKGINVSKTIARLGGTSIATGFLGGNAGRTMTEMLKKENFACDFVFLEGETRTNTKVCDRDGRITELNEPGPQVTEADLAKLMEKISSYAKEETILVLSGSVPAGVPKTIYADLIHLAHAKGARVLLDADGELLKYGLAAGPDILKPNIEELSAYMEQSSERMFDGGHGRGNDWKAEPDRKQDTLQEQDTLREQKIQMRQLALPDTMVVSMGGDGAVFCMNGEYFTCPALSVEVRSTVGAGDAMVAALAYSLEQGLTGEEVIRLCMAVSAGAVTTVGTKPPEAELVENLKIQVQIRKYVNKKLVCT